MILTIGIPTYNRHKSLIRQLNRIKNASGFDLVRVIIYDNSENNKTSEAVRRMCLDQRIKNVIYYKNENNVGFDGNVVNIYNATTSKYLWILSDDDAFVLTDIYPLLNLLEKESPDLVCVNSFARRGLLSYSKGQFVKLSRFEKYGLQLELGKTMILDSEYERVTALMMIGFVSHCLIRRNSNEIESDVSGSLGGVPQLYLANMSLIGGGNRFYVTDFAGVRPGRKDSYSEWFLRSSIYGVLECLGNQGMKLSAHAKDMYVAEILMYVLSTIKNTLSNKEFIPLAQGVDVVSLIDDCERIHVQNAYYSKIREALMLCRQSLEREASKYRAFPFYVTKLKFAISDTIRAIMHK